MVMTDDEASAPATASIEQRKGYGTGLTALGVVTLAAILVIGDSPLEDLVFCLIFTAVFGVLMWLLTRRDAEREASAGRPGAAEARRGFVRGLAQAALVAVGIGAVLALYVWAVGPDRGWAALPAVMLGSGLWVALEALDRRRRERRTARGQAGA